MLIFPTTITPSPTPRAFSSGRTNSFRISPSRFCDDWVFSRSKFWVVCWLIFESLSSCKLAASHLFWLSEGTRAGHNRQTKWRLGKPPGALDPDGCVVCWLIFERLSSCKLAPSHLFWLWRARAQSTIVKQNAAGKSPRGIRRRRFSPSPQGTKYITVTQVGSWWFNSVTTGFLKN